MHSVRATWIGLAIAVWVVLTGCSSNGSDRSLPASLAKAAPTVDVAAAQSGLGRLLRAHPHANATSLPSCPMGDQPSVVKRSHLQQIFAPPFVNAADPSRTESNLADFVLANEAGTSDVIECDTTPRLVDALKDPYLSVYAEASLPVADIGKIGDTDSPTIDGPFAFGNGVVHAGCRTTGTNPSDPTKLPVCVAAWTTSPQLFGLATLCSWPKVTESDCRSVLQDSLSQFAAALATAR